MFCRVSDSILLIFASSAPVNVAAAPKAKVSVPAPPSTVSVTRAVVELLLNSDSAVETLIMSLPPPALILSAPSVAEFSCPSIVSTPEPPVITSFTVPPCRLLVPLPAVIVVATTLAEASMVVFSPASNDDVSIVNADKLAAPVVIFASAFSV